MFSLDTSVTRLPRVVTKSERKLRRRGTLDHRLIGNLRHSRGIHVVRGPCPIAAAAISAGSVMITDIPAADPGRISSRHVPRKTENRGARISIQIGTRLVLRVQLRRHGVGKLSSALSAVGISWSRAVRMPQFSAARGQVRGEVMAQRIVEIELRRRSRRWSSETPASNRRRVSYVLLASRTPC